MKISKEISSIVPYKPGKPIEETKREYGISEVYKLASNENALGPSPKVVKALQNAISQIHRYPDGACYNLTQKISKLWRFESTWIGLGNGSNEIIDILIRTFCEPGDKIITTQAAFLCYPLSAQAARVGTDYIPLKPNYQMDLKRLGEELKPGLHKMVFIPNPNNPTGTYVPSKEVEEFLNKFGQRDDLLIVFDEAYTEFVRSPDYKSAINYVKDYKNVVVMRTMSKVYGLASLRLGIMIARPEVTDFYHRVRNPFNVNDLAQVAGCAALDDYEYVKASQELVWRGLDYFYMRLGQMGLPYIPSQANFVMFDTLRDSALVNEALLKRGVIMRPIKNYGFPTHLRVSVGLEHENKVAMDALEKVIQEIEEGKK